MPGAAVKSRNRWPGVLLVAAIMTTLPAWWQIAWPVLTLDAFPQGRHVGHFNLLYTHALGGSVMLVAGAAALALGWTRARPHLHRPVGYAYLLGGLWSTVSVLVVTLVHQHGSIGVRAATSSLALVWLLTAGMAYRAVRNRRFESHRDWMLRSYVLTWSFVFCRLTSQVPAVAAAGEEVGTALTWATWVFPLLICEAALQWSAGAALRSRRAASRAGLGEPASGV